MNIRHLPVIAIACGITGTLLFTHSRTPAAVLTSPPLAPAVAIRGLHLAPLQQLEVRQDPFIAPVDDGVSLVAEGPPPANSGAAPPADNAADLPLPAAAAVAQNPLPPIAVRGVVIGDHRYAVVDEGNAQRIVTVGDKLAGSAVKSISLQGVSLENGAHYAPSGGSQ